jgi:hypothetical protein
MSENLTLLKNFIFFIFCLSLIGCSAFNSPVSKNKTLYNEFIYLENTSCFYAEQIINKIPDPDQYESSSYFKFILSLKTEPFDKNFKLIRAIKNKKYKIKGAIAAANKYSYLERYELAQKLLFYAEKEIYLQLEKEKTLSNQTAMLFNELLLASLNFKDFSVFEEICNNIISKSEEKFFNPYQLRPLMVPLKKYITGSFKKKKSYSKKILFFTQSIAWEMEPESKNKIPEINFDLYLTEISMPVFTNHNRLKAISLIQLAEIYSDINQPKEIYPVYIELIRIWEDSIENPHLGKSFGIYIPQFVKLLFAHDYHKEALYFISLIPDVYPYYINDAKKLPRPSLAYHKFKLKEYNKTAVDHKYTAFKNIVSLIYKKKGQEFTSKWIETNVKENIFKIKLFSRLSYLKKHKSDKIIEKIINLSPDYLKKPIDVQGLQTIYLPVLFNLYFNDPIKFEKFEELISKKIEMLSQDDEKIFLYIKFSKETADLMPEKSKALCLKAFSLFFEKQGKKTPSDLTLLQKMMMSSVNSPNQCCSLEKFTDFSKKYTQSIYVAGNPDRTYENKIDSHFITAGTLTYLNKTKKAEVFLDEAKTYIELLDSSELKKSYALSLFMRYSKLKNYEKAYKIFNLFHLEDHVDDDFIIKLTRLFIINDKKKYRWLLFDINNDGDIDFINPEASEKLFKTHLNKVRF